jgi:hypothetical protein
VFALSNCISNSAFADMITRSRPLSVQAIR